MTSRLISQFRPERWDHSRSPPPGIFESLRLRGRLPDASQPSVNHVASLKRSCPSPDTIAKRPFVVFLAARTPSSATGEATSG